MTKIKGDQNKDIKRKKIKTNKPGGISKERLNNF
jgi:hypothetical protein